MKKVNPSSVRYRETVFGKSEVTYDCPECGQNLKSPLSEAGIQDHCPHCECEFIVPGSEEKKRRTLAIEAERLKEQQANEAERLREKQAEKRLREQQAKEAERLREKQAKGRTSNHYMSLGLMYLVSVITKAFWIALLTILALGAFVGSYANKAVGVPVFFMCTLGTLILGFLQWVDIFNAREAFKNGSDPSKTID